MSRLSCHSTINNPMNHQRGNHHGTRFNHLALRDNLACPGTER